MIDLHCHILPALDDGALDLEDSLAMARTAAADGIEAVCATPHIRHDHDVRIAELPERVTRLNAALDAEGVALTVLTGGEVAETIVSGLTDDELRAVTLGGGGRWILLEPAPGPLSAALVATVEQLRARGFRSLIAHPERHLGERAEEHLAECVERGALVQATADLLLREDTAPVLLDLAHRGLVHLVASDAHSSLGGRPARLADAIAVLERSAPLTAHVDWIARDGPAAIVRGEEVAPPFPA